MRYRNQAFSLGNSWPSTKTITHSSNLATCVHILRRLRSGAAGSDERRRAGGSPAARRRGPGPNRATQEQALVDEAVGTSLGSEAEEVRKFKSPGQRGTFVQSTPKSASGPGKGWQVRTCSMDQATVPACQSRRERGIPTHTHYRTLISQISSAYSLIVRSDENHAAPAIFKMLFCHQSFGSFQVAATRFCASL